MRINQPCTEKMKNYDSSVRLFSTTTLKGVIEDMNEDFIQTSGFSREELIGQAHNIVRHPTMPQAAFSEMWEFLKNSKPWMGMVKNRCKNGDHYWVDAFVTPTLKNGKVVGFQSVRKKPDQEWIDRANSEYAMT